MSKLNPKPALPAQSRSKSDDEIACEFSIAESDQARRPQRARSAPVSYVDTSMGAVDEWEGLQEALRLSKIEANRNTATAGAGGAGGRGKARPKTKPVVGLSRRESQVASKLSPSSSHYDDSGEGASQGHTATGKQRKIVDILDKGGKSARGAEYRKACGRLHHKADCQCHLSSSYIRDSGAPMKRPINQVTLNQGSVAGEDFQVISPGHGGHGGSTHRKQAPHGKKHPIAKKKKKKQKKEEWPGEREAIRQSLLAAGRDPDEAESDDDEEEVEPQLRSRPSHTQQQQQQLDDDEWAPESKPTSRGLPRVPSNRSKDRFYPEYGHAREVAMRKLSSSDHDVLVALKNFWGPQDAGWKPAVVNNKRVVSRLQPPRLHGLGQPPEPPGVIHWPGRRQQEVEEKEALEEEDNLDEDREDTAYQHKSSRVRVPLGVTLAEETDRPNNTADASNCSRSPSVTAMAAENPRSEEKPDSETVDTPKEVSTPDVMSSEYDNIPNTVASTNEKADISLTRDNSMSNGELRSEEKPPKRPRIESVESSSIPQEESNAMVASESEATVEADCEKQDFEVEMLRLMWHERIGIYMQEVTDPDRWYHSANFVSVTEDEFAENSEDELDDSWINKANSKLLDQFVHPIHRN